MDTNDDYYKLTLQQQRFCDEYLIHFNAFKAAANAGYSENTARKGELLHLPKIQLYLKDQMRRTQSRLEITHDMILTELAKIAFSNMGNYFDEYAVLKPMHRLSADEKAAISQYQVLDATDEYGHRVGELSKIKLHNKMAALDKIARHLGFYEVSRKSESPEVGKMEGEYQVASITYQDEEGEDGLEVGKMEVEESGIDTPLTTSRSELGTGSLERSSASLDIPFQFPPTGMGATGSDVAGWGLFARLEAETPPYTLPEGGQPTNGSSFMPKKQAQMNNRTDPTLLKSENMENILTLSPLYLMTDGLNDRMIEVRHQLLKDSMTDGLNDRVIELNRRTNLDGAELSSEIATSSQPLAGELLAMTFEREFALGTGADTGPSTGSGQAVVKACAV